MCQAMQEIIEDARNEYIEKNNKLIAEANEAKANEAKLRAEAKANETKLRAEAKANEAKLRAEAKAKERKLRAKAKANEKKAKAEIIFLFTGLNLFIKM